MHARAPQTVLGHVHALVLLVFEEQVVDQFVVEILAAEVVVAVARQHVHLLLADLEDGDIEGAAAEIVHEDSLRCLALLEVVCQRGRSGLVQDAEDSKAGDVSRLLRRFPLRVVEVRGHGDHRVLDALSQKVLGLYLQVVQNHGTDLFRSE